ncbi:DUF3021 family protein [Periweissella cryptocerci]|uniref:DUF3021 family protein n=1 Tax=Periweissella cryptocerci TaxID=2506420 RepID=A0A4V1AIU1_9LACO|nr:DUF3021 family protein [Periweissella cryptocerci]QBO36685.1 DUF3021 family protein [Periweissella cryptocerci]
MSYLKLVSRTAWRAVTIGSIIIVVNGVLTHSIPTKLVISVFVMAFLIGLATLLYKIERLPLLTVFILHYVITEIVVIIVDGLTYGFFTTPLGLFSEWLTITIIYFIVWGIKHGSQIYEARKLNVLNKQRQQK